MVRSLLDNKNKKGQINGLFLFFIIIGGIVVLGLLIGIGGYLTKQIVTPTISAFKDVGSVDENTNVTEYTELASSPYTTMTNSLNWITGILYFIMILGSVGFAFFMRNSSNKGLLGLYFAFMILIIIVSILVSNAYQNMYEDGSDLGTELKSYTLLSFLVLNAPIIFTVIGFISGIIIFTGRQEDEAYA